MYREVSLTLTESQTYVRVPFVKGVEATLSLRKAGDMRLANRERREEYLNGLGIKPEYTAYLEQIHSQKVLIPDRGKIPVQGDGLVSREINTALCVTVADCLPVFLYDRQNTAIGLVHSGWKGTGIVSQALQTMGEAFGTRPPELEVLLGPCISSSCYRVDRERCLRYQEKFGEEAVMSADGEWFLDMRGANLSLLRAEGVTNITVVTNCTHCHQELGSFRRDGPEGYSLMLAVLRLV